MRFYSLIALFLFICPCILEAQGLEAKLNQLLANSSGVYVSVIDLNTGKTIYNKNASVPTKPASVMKLVTTYSALKTLGSDYTFKTGIYGVGEKNGYVDALYVVGGGDPTLTTETLWIIARAIKRHGIKEIGKMYLDPTFYQTVYRRHGQRAYQAGTSGLAFNFNTITFEVCPTKEGQPAIIKQEPWEYQINKIGKIVTSASGGSYSVNDVGEKNCGGKAAFKFSGKIKSKAGCANVYRSLACPEGYLAETLKGFLGELGIKIKNGATFGLLPNSARKIYTHVSRPLSQIVEDMNKYSNNFMAEQILVAMDTAHRGGHKERQAALNRVNSILKELGGGQYKLIDASGLSHENRLTVGVIANLLKSAWNDPSISAEFLKSLAVGGLNGTLRLRKLKFPNAVVRAKTGTIDGVSGLAGYIITSKQKYAFAILQNNGTSHIAKHRLEERVVQVILN